MANNTGQKFGGRTKGTKNKDMAQIRDCFQNLIESNLHTLETDLKQLEPRDRIKAILDLSRFVIPQLKATDHTITKNEIAPIIINLGDGTDN